MNNSKRAQSKKSLDETGIAPFLEAMTLRKAKNVTALDLRGISSVADWFIIASARSTRQAGAIADAAEDFLAARKIKPIGVEGKPENQWILLDYGDVVIHVFFEAVRLRFDLEGLWAEAPRIYPAPGAGAGDGDEDEDGQDEDLAPNQDDSETGGDDRFWKEERNR